MLFKKSKKNIAILMVIAMLLTIMPMTVFAEGEEGAVVTIEPTTTEVTTGQAFTVTATITTSSAITTPSMIWYVDGSENGSESFDGGLDTYTAVKDDFSLNTIGTHTIKAEFLNDGVTIGSAECIVTAVEPKKITEDMLLDEIKKILTGNETVQIEGGDYTGINFPGITGKTVFINGEVKLKNLTLTDTTVKGLTGKETDKLNVVVNGSAVGLNGNEVKIENVALDVTGSNFNYLICWNASKLYVIDARLSACDNQADGSGIFVNSSAKECIGENSDFDFSGNGVATKTKRCGIWADTDGNPKVELYINGGTFKLNNNGLNGFQGPTYSFRGKPIIVFTNTDVEACGNGAYEGSLDRGDGFSYGYISLYNTDGEKHYFKVNGNTNNGVDGGNLSNAAFDAYNYIIEANNNGNIGINISQLNNGTEKATILENCSVTASGNGNIGLSFEQLTQIKNSRIIAHDNGNIGMKNTKNLNVDSSVMHIQNSKNAHDATYSSLTKNIVTVLNNYDVIALGGNDMDSNFKYVSGKNQYLGKFVVEGGSLQADKAIDYATYHAELADSSTYPTKMSDNPVNENGTALYRFDLHQDVNVEVGQLSNQSKQLERNFAYYDNEKEYPYGFRFNTVGEDLEETAAGNAYVWTPVSVLHYDATEGYIPGTQKGSTTLTDANGAVKVDKSADSRYAGDVTIYGNSLNLAEKTMPTAARTGYVFLGWYVADDEEKAKEYASKGEFENLYKLLNTEFTASSKVATDLNDVSKGQADKTIYAKWASTLIQGTIFEDGTRNNVLDTNEYVFEKIPVRLMQDGKVVATTETNVDGKYRFDGVDLGKYTVEIDWPKKDNVAMKNICTVNNTEAGNKFNAGTDNAFATSIEIEISEEFREATLNAGFYNTSGGGGSTTDPDPVGPGTDEPTVDIPDPDVPLTEPDEPEDPTIDIEDPDVPLVDVPGETVEIEEPEVPLGDAPATGDRSAAIPFAVLMLIAAAGLAITRKRFN